MAKKKNIPISIVEYERTYPDNNPDGPSRLPDDELNGTMYPKGKFDFVNLVAGGESPIAPDCYSVNANGVSRSRDEGKNQDYKWGDSTDGIWCKNKPFKGGNLSGL